MHASLKRILSVYFPLLDGVCIYSTFAVDCTSNCVSDSHGISQWEMPPIGVILEHTVITTCSQAVWDY